MNNEKPNENQIKKKRNYLTISKSWGECECGCGRIISPPSLMCNVEGFFYIATHEKNHFEMYGSYQSTIMKEEAVMSTPKKKAVKKETAKKKPVVKKTVAKKAVAKKAAPVKETVKKAAAPKAPVEKKAPRITPNSMCRQLLLERIYTDEIIYEKVKEVFPDSKFSKSYVSTTRVDLNKGVYKSEQVDTPIQKLVLYKGKVITSDEQKKLREDEEAEKRAQRKADKPAPKVPVSAAKKKLPIKKV